MSNTDGVAKLQESMARQLEFSLKTFGPGRRKKGVLDHMAKEAIEVLNSEGDPQEWVDLAILSRDLITRHYNAVYPGLPPAQAAHKSVDSIVASVQMGLADDLPWKEILERFQSIAYYYHRIGEGQMSGYPGELTYLAYAGLFRVLSNEAPEATTQEISDAATDLVEAKLEKNRRRTWPDWRTSDPDKAIEHVRGIHD